MAPGKHKGVMRGNRIFIIHREGEIILHQEITITITPAENAVLIMYEFMVLHGFSSLWIYGLISTPTHY
jgi:hypothetical protein